MVSLSDSVLSIFKHKKPIYFWVYITILLISMYLDNDIQLCNKIIGKLIIIFHHILGVFMLTAPFLFIIPEIHLIILLFTIVSWTYFKNCFITLYSNNICNVSKKNKFNDISKYLNILLYKWTPIQSDKMRILLGCLIYMIYDIYAIMVKHTS